MPYSSQIVYRFFIVPHRTYEQGRNLWEGASGLRAYSPYLRRIESLTIYGCYYKGSTFSSVILRPWMLVQLELNLQTPGW